MPAKSNLRTHLPELRQDFVQQEQNESAVLKGPRSYRQKKASLPETSISIFRPFSKENSKPLQASVSQENLNNQKPLKPQLLDEASNTIQIYNYKIFDQLNLPEVREKAALIVWKDRLIMFGGLGRRVHRQIIEMSLREFTWRRLDRLLVNGELPLEGRYGHQMTLVKGKIYLTGGQKGNTQNVKMLDLQNEIQIVDPYTLTAENLHTYGDIIESRSEHAAFSIGKFFYVFGGINSNHRHLTDIMQLNTETLKVMRILHEEFPYEDGVAQHKAIAVFRGEPILNSIYEPFAQRRFPGEKRLRRVREEGIYCFGGKRASGEAVGKLLILKIGKKRLQWIEPEVFGVAPTARYSHCLEYFPALSILIIVGGRNEALKQKLQSPSRRESQEQQFLISQSPFLSDVCVFNLETMHWMHINCNGLTLPPLASSSSCIAESRLLIFGGFSGGTFARSEVIVIELDQEKIRKFKRDLQVYSNYYLSFSEQGHTLTKDIFGTFTASEESHYSQDFFSFDNLEIGIRKGQRSSMLNVFLTKRSKTKEDIDNEAAGFAYAEEGTERLTWNIKSYQPLQLSRATAALLGNANKRDLQKKTFIERFFANKVRQTAGSDVQTLRKTARNIQKALQEAASLTDREEQEKRSVQISKKSKNVDSLQSLLNKSSESAQNDYSPKKIAISKFKSAMQKQAFTNVV